MQSNDPDAVIPVHIEHRIDEIWNEDVLEQSYNFLDYHFEYPTAYFRARAYLDDLQKVTLSGPFDRRGSRSRITAPDEEVATVDYLKRRFAIVQRR